MNKLIIPLLLIIITGCSFSKNSPNTLSSQNDFNTIVKQETDYSCGAAALATLLRYDLGDSVTEKELLQQLLKPLPPTQALLKQQQGFSLLDLQTVARQRGYKAMGFYLDADNLKKLSSPVIVFIQPQGYKHFSVLKGIYHNIAYLADSALGNIQVPLNEFLTIWQTAQGKGIVFVVEQKDKATVHLLNQPK
ncbi:MAG: C39 family peptidase [Methylococcaceae bacterium]